MLAPVPDDGPDVLTEHLTVSPQAMDRLQVYVEVLVKWQARINLVGRGSLDQLWHRHILDSAQLHPVLPDGASCLVDMGSGAGLPGLVLAAMGVPAVHLVESDQRKAAFLREAARAMGVSVTVHACRIEETPPLTADVVTARALAPLEKLLTYGSRFQGRDTVFLFPKGKTADQEVTDCQKTWTMTATRYPSLSDPSGVIVKLERISRRHGFAD